MSSRLNNLLAQAAVIRDATEEHENTAVRVGTMFVDFIQACLAVLPTEIIDATGITTSTSETNFVVRYRVVDEEGNTSNRTITIPVASSENAGLMTPAQLTAVNNVTNSLQEVLNALANKADATAVAEALAEKADATAVAEALAEKANTSDVEAALRLKADKGDLAKLDDTLEFSGVLETATITQGTSEKKSTDGDVNVFYVTALRQFVLGVRTDVTLAEVMPEYATPRQAPGEGAVALPRLTDVEIKTAIRLDAFPTLYDFYLDWADRELYSTSEYKPLSGKSFICTSTDVLYFWKASANTLQPMGKDFSTEISNLQQSITNTNTAVTNLNTKIDNTKTNLEASIAPRLFFNGNVLTNKMSQNLSLSQFVALTAEDDFAHVRIKGVVITLSTGDGLKSYQWKGTTWGDVEDWKEFGGSAAVGNCYNVTNEIPVSGYYDLEHAIAATFNKGLAAVGMLITFAIGAGTWKTYQYVGSDTTESNFTNAANWVDTAGMSAGSETVVNILNMCGTCAEADFYRLPYAISALMRKQRETGISYAKSGLIITYPIGEFSWETKQFIGDVTDFANEELWHDFGNGGSSSSETSDTPEENGTDAFSTGGAYEHLPVNLDVDTETPGVVKMQMINAGGEAVGDQVQFSVGTGGGGGSDGGTVVAIAVRDNPLYGKAGGSFVVKAAIMSVTTIGSQQTSNAISMVEVIDRTTKQILATIIPVDKTSSATMQDYKFNLDISSLFATAGQYSLQLRATDDDGNTATKNISVVAVDVTCVSTQTLNYTSDTSLEVGGRAKLISLFSFPNNASAQGIRAIVEIYKGGEWVEILNQVITDTYAHKVSIDPTGLAHGAYPIRIHGIDVASGVVGNVLHTSVMVIQTTSTHADYNKPIVVARWSDASNGTVALYDTVSFDIAAFQNEEPNPVVTVTLENVTQGTSVEISSQTMLRSSVYGVTKRLTDYNDGDVLTFIASCGNIAMPEPLAITIDGTLIPISESEGAVFKIDMAGRSNADSDKSISVPSTEGDNVTIEVTGANYRTNGFVKDSFGTEPYGTINDTGRMALRVAENVTALCDFKPFAKSSIENNGLALSLTVMTKNVADPNAHLIECMGNQLGFVLTGERLIFTTSGSLDGRNNSTVAIVPHVNGVVMRYDFVIEPTENAPYGGIGVVKIFRNGDEVGAAAYTAGELAVHENGITFDGTYGDIYLYSMAAWNNHYNFMQAFENYLIGLTDTTAMITEYNKNNVMASQTAEGTTKDRPSMQKCLDAGIMVVALTKNPDTDDEPGNYPDYLETLDGDKKTKKELDWYCYFPDRPWQDCRIVRNSTTNQGTTSSWRKIKNKKGKSKGKTIELLHTRDEIARMYDSDPTILAKYDECARQAAKGRIQIVDGGKFTNIVTIKVDYSDSCGAHNCAMMELMNDTQMELGENYRTPAQNANEDTTEIHTSIDGVPCALFRTDSAMNVNDACDPGKAYFHAKANFNADKGDASYFGFEGVKGYNANCLNYGDFIEMVAAKNQSLTNFKDAILADTSELIAGNIYVLSEYCGPGHVVLENDGNGSMQEVASVESPTSIDKTLAQVQADDVENYDWRVVYLTSDGHYVQYQGGSWIDKTGTMTYNPSTKKWSVTDRFVNPVECFEFLKYDSLCWGQDVNSVEDMMRIDSSTGNPIWMSYYESRYPDNDELTALYEAGKKVPYQLYRWLMWCQQCNQHLTASDGNITINGTTVAGTPANRLLKFRRELWQYASPYSNHCYVVASDYKAAIDQRSKNMMIAFYLDINGLMRAYFNHWYDGDGVDGSDNDCGLTIPWDMDAKTSHLYQGWDGVMFVQSYAAFDSRATDNQGNVTDDGGVWLDGNGSSTLNLQQVAEKMRKLTKNGRGIFSADGCFYYWSTKRIEKWAKVISSFDGERKYIQNSTAAANYFYALHGLRYEDLPDYQRKRFAFRDGYYQVGDLYKNPFKARMMGTIAVTITAAQDGFFGLGEDRADTCADSCYLHAGESYTLRAKPAQKSGKMIYIFGADKLAVLDISACTPKQEAFDISSCTMLQQLIVGGSSYSSAYLSSALTRLDLPSMPFLTKIDIRKTAVQAVVATNCPRLQTLLAGGSALSSFSPADTSPLVTVELPSSMTMLQFIGIPNLHYPNGGLTIAGFALVNKMRVEDSANINASTLLGNVLLAQASNHVLSSLRIAGQTMTGDGSDLATLVTLNVKGLDSAGQEMSKPVIEATYELTRLYETTDISAWEAAIYGLTVVTVIDAYITLINEINDEDYGGTSEVETVTLANIDELALTYYNGEQYDDYLAQFAADNADINNIVTS